MKSNTWRWVTKVMGIGAFGVMLLSIGAGPAAAITPKPCTTCEPGEGGPPTPPPPPPPPPPYSCQYDDLTTTSVPPIGSPPPSALNIQRATEETIHAGLCVFACPNASISFQTTIPGTVVPVCDCYNDTIPQLRAAGVGHSTMFNTRYSIWSEPPVASTRTLLVALAGQNGLSSGGSSGGGGPGNITGQPNHWDAECSSWNGHCGSQTFDAKSFVWRLLTAPGLNINTTNTFAVSFPDHQYEYQSSEKDKIISGLVNWLSTKVSPTALKQIIIAGHSRGSCLTLGLIQAFRNRPAFNQVRILGTPVDGTCTNDGEMGTHSGGANNIDNPLPDVPADWFAWNSSFDMASKNASVCIQNTVGGEPQGLWPVIIHSFSLSNPAWHNTFMNIPHKMSGQCPDDNIATVDNGVCVQGDATMPTVFNVKSNVVDRALRFVEHNIRLP